MRGGVERRASEFRASGDGATLQGVVVPYNMPATIGNFTERFEPGSIAFADVIANVQHNRNRPLARTGGGGLSLEDSERELRAAIELPDTADGRDVRELVRRGVMRGLSAEFHVTRETWQGSQRTIHAATLTGVAIVDSGAYAGATVAEVRENTAGVFELAGVHHGGRLWRYL